MTINDYLRVAETGDLQMSSGSSSFSVIIKNATGCEFSHAAVFVWGQHCGQEPGTPWIWESAGAGVGEVPFIHAVTTRDINWLRRRLNPGAGRIAVRQLVVDRTPEMYASLKIHFDECRGWSYEQDKWELVRAVGWIGGLAKLVGRESESNLASQFCWEAAIAALQAFGAVPPEPPANHYSNNMCAYQDFPMLLGAKLLPLEEIEL